MPDFYYWIRSLFAHSSPEEKDLTTNSITYMFGDFEQVLASLYASIFSSIKWDSNTTFLSTHSNK